MEYVNDKSKEELVVEEKFFDEANALFFSQRGSKLDIENRIYSYLFRLAFNFGMMNIFIWKKTEKKKLFTSFFQTISLSFNIFRPAFNFGIHSSTINIFSKKSRRSKVGFDIYVTKKKISHAFSREPFQRGSRSGSALEKIGNFIWRGCATGGCSR